MPFASTMTLGKLLTSLTLESSSQSEMMTDLSHIIAVLNEKIKFKKPLSAEPSTYQLLSTL